MLLTAESGQERAFTRRGTVVRDKEISRDRCRIDGLCIDATRRRWLAGAEYRRSCRASSDERLTRRSAVPGGNVDRRGDLVELRAVLEALPIAKVRFSYLNAGALLPAFPRRSRKGEK